MAAAPAAAVAAMTAPAAVAVVVALVPVAATVTVSVAAPPVVPVMVVAAVAVSAPPVVPAVMVMSFASVTVAPAAVVMLVVVVVVAAAASTAASTAGTGAAATTTTAATTTSTTAATAGTLPSGALTDRAARRTEGQPGVGDITDEGGQEGASGNRRAQPDLESGTGRADPQDRGQEASRDVAGAAARVRTRAPASARRHVRADHCLRQEVHQRYDDNEEHGKQERAPLAPGGAPRAAPDGRTRGEPGSLGTGGRGDGVGRKRTGFRSTAAVLCAFPGQWATLPLAVRVAKKV